MRASRLGLCVFAALVLVTSFFIGNRGLEVGADTSTYANKFVRGVGCKCLGGNEIGFELFVYPMYLLSFSPELIFFCISLLVFLLVYVVARKVVNDLTPAMNEVDQWKFKSCLTLFSFIVVTPILIQIHINAIRQGLSALFFLVSYLYVMDGKKKASVVFLVAAIVFHYSALLIAPFFMLFFYFRFPLNAAFFLSSFLFVLFSLFYLLGFSEVAVKEVSIFFNMSLWEAVSSYGVDSNYRSGVRYDFYFFTVFVMMPIFMYALYDVRARAFYIFVVISVIPFLILGWGAYSNRYLLNSWLYIIVGLGMCLLLVFRRAPAFAWLFLCLSCAFNVYYVVSKG